MNGELIQTVMEVVMEYFSPYLGPVLFVFVVVLLADRILDVFYDALALHRSRRR